MVTVSHAYPFAARWADLNTCPLDRCNETRNLTGVRAHLGREMGLRPSSYRWRRDDDDVALRRHYWSLGREPRRLAVAPALQAPTGAVTDTLVTRHLIRRRPLH